MVGGEPLYARTFGAGGDVVLLVPGHGGDVEALSVVDGSLALPVDDIVYGAGIAPVEHVHIEQVLAQEVLVLDLGDFVLSVLSYDNDFRKVGAVADVAAVVVLLEPYAHEALGEVGVEFGVVVDYPGGGNGLETGKLGAAREIGPVLALEVPEPVDRIFVYVLNVGLDILHLVLDAEYLLVHRLGVELGDFSHRLLDKGEYVVHYDLAVEEVLVFLHLREHVVHLLLPAHLVLLQDLVYAVLEEDALQGTAVPLCLQLVKFDVELLEQQVTGVESAVFQYVVDREESRLVVLDDAGVGVDGVFAVGEGIEGIYGLVRGHVAGKVDEYVHLVRGHILDFLDLDLALLLGLEYGFDEVAGVFAVRGLRDCDSALVDFLDARTHLHAAAPAAFTVIAAVGESAGREVRENPVLAAFHNRDGSVEQFVEVVGQYLGRETHADALGALREQEREAQREFGRLLVASVVRGHPVRDLRVEHDLLCELAQPRFDVSRCSIGVAGEDVAPVTLAIHGEAFLAELDQGSEYGLVSVRVVLHSLAHDVRDLGVFAVVHLVHGVEHPALHGLESVDDVRYGAMQDHV